MTKILLTSVFRPFGTNDKYNKFTPPMEFFIIHLGDQGIFSPNEIHLTHALYYIAKNIKAKTVVLDFPSIKEFSREVKKGYDYVGISYICLAFEKVKKMCEIIREITPKTKIILGGFGAVIPESQKIADYV